jgi:DNA-binding response OmpR family regulator
VAKTIIVVDDNEIIREYTSYLLKEAGYIVVPTSNKADASKVLTGVIADAIILEWESESETFVAFMRELQPCPKMIITSAAAIDDKISARGLPFLRKPFGPMELLGTIDNCLRAATA